MDDQLRDEEPGPASTPPDAPSPGARDSVPDPHTPPDTPPPAPVLHIGPLPPWAPRPRRRRPPGSAQADGASADPLVSEPDATDPRGGGERTTSLIAGGTPAEDLPEIAEWWRLFTRTGSRYIVARDHTGRWWFGGTNVPNAVSTLLPPGYWWIERPVPWPPVIEQPVSLLAPAHLHPGHPGRAPHGGKVTSNVRRVERLSAAPEGC